MLGQVGVASLDLCLMSAVALAALFGLYLLLHCGYRFEIVSRDAPIWGGIGTLLYRQGSW